MKLFFKMPDSMPQFGFCAAYDRFTTPLPETCAGLKADPAALELVDFTYVAAGPSGGCGRRSRAGADTGPELFGD
jgi:hypothetical protein